CTDKLPAELNQFYKSSWLFPLGLFRKTTTPVSIPSSNFAGNVMLNGKIAPPSMELLFKPPVPVGNFMNGKNANAVRPPSFPHRLTFKRVMKLPTPDKTDIFFAVLSSVSSCTKLS